MTIDDQLSRVLLRSWAKHMDTASLWRQVAAQTLGDERRDALERARRAISSARHCRMQTQAFV